MPSASTASPASPSTKTESSLCVRTIPGWERLATSRETRSLIGPRSSWRPAECSLRVRWGRPSAASVRRSCRQRERPPSMRDRSPAPPGEPKAHGDDGGESERRHDPGDLGSVRRDPRLQRRVLDHHLARDIPQQTSAREHEYREARDQAHDDLAADDDDRNAGDEPEHDEQPIAFCRRRNAYDVVETHDEVGDDDRPYRRQQPVAGLDLVLATVVLGDELDPDPQQQRPADQPEPGICEEAHREEREHDPEHDRAEHAPEDALPPLPLRQVAAGKRDDDRVVAGQQDVDEDDLDDCKPELRCSQFNHAGSAVTWTRKLDNRL